MIMIASFFRLTKRDFIVQLPILQFVSACGMKSSHRLACIANVNLISGVHEATYNRFCSFYKLKMTDVLQGKHYQAAYTCQLWMVNWLQTLTTARVNRLVVFTVHPQYKTGSPCSGINLSPLWTPHSKSLAEHLTQNDALPHRIQIPLQLRVHFVRIELALCPSCFPSEVGDKLLDFHTFIHIRCGESWPTRNGMSIPSLTSTKMAWRRKSFDTFRTH